MECLPFLWLNMVKTRIRWLVAIIYVSVVVFICFKGDSGNIWTCLTFIFLFILKTHRDVTVGSTPLPLVTLLSRTVQPPFSPSEYWTYFMDDPLGDKSTFWVMIQLCNKINNSLFFCISQDLSKKSRYCQPVEAMPGHQNILLKNYMAFE